MAGAKVNKKGQKQSTQQQQQQQHTSVKKEKHTKKSKESQKSTCKKSSCCRWTLGILFLIGAITAVIIYDVNKNGNGVFEKSAFGKFLKDTGALPYVEVATVTTLHYSAVGYQWAEINVPVAYNTTKVHVTPYCRFMKDLAIITWNAMKQGFNGFSDYVKTKTPIVISFIEQYAPGLPGKISEFSSRTWETIVSVTINAYRATVDFFKTKVFVGNWSPDNLNKYLNSTQIRVVEYCDWFHKQVDHYAKLKTIS